VKGLKKGLEVWSHEIDANPCRNIENIRQYSGENVTFMMILKVRTNVKKQRT